MDSHCHLNFPQFAGVIDEILDRAYDSNVRVMQTISTKPSEIAEVIKLASSHDGLCCSVGVHPNEVSDLTMLSCNQLCVLARNGKVVALGETGLDYYRTEDEALLSLQQDSFREHILASAKTGLPVIVHTRDAEEDTWKILSKAYEEAPFTGLIHCFGGSLDFAYKCISIGLYISISGIITFKNARELQEVVKELPLERLLIETDSPFLAPVPHRGKTNEPTFVKYVCKKIADLKGLSFETVAEVTTENFFNLFNKVKYDKD